MKSATWRGYKGLGASPRSLNAVRDEGEELEDHGPRRRSLEDVEDGYEDLRNSVRTSRPSGCRRWRRRLEDRNSDLEGFKEHKEELEEEPEEELDQEPEEELKEERKEAAEDGAAPAPASARAGVKHSLEEDYFKT